MSPQPIKGPLDDPWSRMMTAAIAGDEGAYRRLLEDIGRSVRAMARGAFARAGVGDADVEDAVQETLLAIHLKRHTWDPEQPLAPWVYAIARHKVVDALRRRGRRKVAPPTLPSPRSPRVRPVMSSPTAMTFILKALPIFATARQPGSGMITNPVGNWLD
jgi:DNA-directed RNA polymerase specialized sigma24 family protein